MRTVEYEDGEGSFRLSVPDGWEVTRDEEGGLLVSRVDGSGVLHLMPFPHPESEELDPAEELYAFLEDQDIELEEDEVEDLDLDTGGAMAVCEYVSEEEDDEGPVYWVVGVAEGPGHLVFASFSCDVGDEEADREVVRRMLASLDFEASDGAQSRDPEVR